MQIREFSKPLTAAKLNESLAQRFGSKIDIDAFTTEQLQDARNKLRTQVFNVETTESFDTVQQKGHTKNKLFLDVLNAALHERDDVATAIDEAIEQVNEGEEDKAELVMAAKDMVDRVTGWMEDTAEMQTESMLELADAIRDEMGQDQSAAFVGAIKPALEALYSTMEQARESLNQGLGMLTGEGEPAAAAMGMEEPAMEPGMEDPAMEPTVDMDAPAAGVGDTAAPAAGAEEPAGRPAR